MDERPTSPDPADPAWLLAQIPDPDPHPGFGQTPQPSAPTQSEQRIAEVEAIVRMLTETVAQLSATVGRVIDNQPAPGATPLAAAEPAGHDELVEWVCWLIDRYGVGHAIPGCWAEHPRLVDELDALRLGWLGTVAPGRPGLDALVWHDHLRRFLKAAAGYDRQCMRGHKATQAPPASDTHRPQRARIDLRADRYQPGPLPPSGSTP